MVQALCRLVKPWRATHFQWISQNRMFFRPHHLRQHQTGPRSYHCEQEDTQRNPGALPYGPHHQGYKGNQHEQPGGSCCDLSLLTNRLG